MPPGKRASRYSLPLFVLLSACALAAGSGGVNAPDHQDKPALVLVSMDGFGHDFRGKAETPALDRLAAGGVHASALVPVYPTLTFPNHYSIATGLYPAEHGIVANHFPGADGEDWYRLSDRTTVQDGRWYGGEPVWVAAEKAGMVTAAFFFVGTEAAIQGISPAYWYPYDGSVPGYERVDQVLEWLAMPPVTRPGLITLYFDDVDLAAHATGPDSPETKAAIRRVDGYLGRLLRGIDDLGLADESYVVVVSDHGQMATDTTTAPYVLSEHVDLRGLTIRDDSSHLGIWLDPADPGRLRALAERVNDTWRHGRAWLREDSPEHWRVGDSARFADLVLMADPGHTVISAPEQAAGIKPGNHGWDPAVPAMHGVFLARGPSIPEAGVAGCRSVVDVYPFMLAALGLPDHRDGTPVSRDLDDVLSSWRTAGSDLCD